jgi:hypothetical protein
MNIQKMNAILILKMNYIKKIESQITLLKVIILKPQLN